MERFKFQTFPVTKLNTLYHKNQSQSKQAIAGPASSFAYHHKKSISNEASLLRLRLWLYFSPQKSISKSEGSLRLTWVGSAWVCVVIFGPFEVFGPKLIDWPRLAWLRPASRIFSNFTVEGFSLRFNHPNTSTIFSNHKKQIHLMLLRLSFQPN